MLRTSLVQDVEEEVVSRVPRRNTIFGPKFNRQTGLMKPVRRPDFPLSFYEEELGPWIFGREPKGHGEILETRITARSSDASSWAATCAEWHYQFCDARIRPGLRAQAGQEGLHEQEDGVCLCMFTPIVKHCHILNRVTGLWASVGSCCIENFMGMQVKPIIAALERIEDDTAHAMRECLIHFAAERGWLNEWEITFCQDTKLKRNLSGRQLGQRMRINRKVIAAHNAIGVKSAAAGAADYLLPSTVTRR